MSAAPWSVKGIDPKAREVAKDLARRSGMTLGEWLNTMIMDDAEDEEPVVPLSRRQPPLSETFDRSARQRRLDEAYMGGSGDTLQRVAASVEVIAARLEAAERRSTVAIQGVDQAVAGLVRRLDGQEHVGRGYGRRMDELAEELRDGNKRLRKFEQESGPKTVETFGKIESGLGALASRLYDIEERQRSSFNELRQRMEAAEKGAAPGAGTALMAQVSARLDQAQAQTTDALRGLERSFAGLDQRIRVAENRVEPEGVREAARFEKLAEGLTRQVDANRHEMMRRLDTVEQETRMSRIEAVVAGAADQVKAAEERSAQGIETMGREVLRIAQHLSGRVQGLDARIDHVEAEVSEKMSSIGQAIAGDLSRTLGDKIDRDLARHAEGVDHRLTRVEDDHAIALERLGDEITRISDRLADRIAQTERKSSQALDDISRRLTDGAERVDQVYGRVSGELGERMRLSEERTARLIDEAREAMERRAERAARIEAPVAAVSAPAPALEEPEPVSGLADFRRPDWRAAAFPDESFDGDDLWASPTSQGGVGPAPFPAFPSVEPAPQRAVAEAVAVDRIVEDDPAEWLASFTFEDEPQPEAVVADGRSPYVEPELKPLTAAAFGGADVSDVLEATADLAPEPPLQLAALASIDGLDARDPDPLDNGVDLFDDDAEFVDEQALRAGLASGAADARAGSTRSAIDAARAAMAETAFEQAPSRGAFGLKRGGKSKLQERLDKQAARNTSTVRKTLLASVTATALVGAVYATGRLSGVDALAIPGVDGLFGISAEPAQSAPTIDDTTLAAVALTGSTTTSPEAQALFDKAVDQLDKGDRNALDTLTQAANLGAPLAQLKLADLYQSGTGGAQRNLAEARVWARRSAEGGDARGMHAYGMYLFDGVGGARSRPEALTWLVKAAEAGRVDSQFNVARIYETGDADGIAPDTAEALKWYMIAAKGGDQQARAAADRLSASVPPVSRKQAQDAAAAFSTTPAG